MEELLYTAAALLIAIGIAHSYLGERYILIRLFRRGDVPKLFGGAEFTVRTLRFAWHITSIAWLGFAVLLVASAYPPITEHVVRGVVGATLFVTAVAIFVGSRGRHLAWIVFLVAGGIALYATGA